MKKNKFRKISFLILKIINTNCCIVNSKLDRFRTKKNLNFVVYNEQFLFQIEKLIPPVPTYHPMSSIRRNVESKDLQGVENDMTLL